MPFTFLLGGARSGKSSLAARLASETGGPVVVVATAEGRDEEMAERIRAHRSARPAAWGTVEAPLGLLAAIERLDEGACVILDCLTLWVSNALEAGTTETEILGEADELARVLAARPSASVVISNEVGLGIVPVERARTDVSRRPRPRERDVRRSRIPLILRRGRPRAPARGRRAGVTGGPLLEATIAGVIAPDEAAALETARRLDAKTKPPGSLGRLEELACRLSAIRGSVPVEPLRPAIVVAAASHGVAARGVSAYPSEVTAQMLANFATGGAAICVLALEAGARLVVVDAGVAGAPEIPGVRIEVVDDVRGTEDLTLGPAMARATALGLVERGIALAHELADDGVEVLGLGEMGIGNTTAAAALAAALLPTDPGLVCGPGTGLDHDGLARKIDAVRRSLDANGLPRAGADPLDVLAAVGGLEIAFLAGTILGASTRRVVVLLDGFITGVAALIAARLAPASVGSMIAATRSPEPGHAPVLEALGLEPLLDLRLRLGEGTGAALALPLVRSAVAIVTDMATFDSAGVSGPASAEPVPATSDA